MKINLPIFDKDGKQVNSITLVYEFSKYVAGLDLDHILDIDGKRMVMNMNVSGNGIHIERQFIGAEVSANCIAVTVGTHLVFVPKYLSFLASQAIDENLSIDPNAEEFVG
jgi:hypothetical protein